MVLPTAIMLLSTISIGAALKTARESGVSRAQNNEDESNLQWIVAQMLGLFATIGMVFSIKFILVTQ